MTSSMSASASEFPEDNDSSDEDYIPGAKPEEVVSEIDSDEELEDDSDCEKKSKKRPKNNKKTRKKQKLPANNCDLSVNQDSKELTEEEKKKVQDDIWANFMKDTGFQSKSTRTENSISTKSDSASKKIYNNKEKSPDRKIDTIKITQVFEFAGEEVSVDREVSKDSTEAKLYNNSLAVNTENSKSQCKRGLSGISSVLSQLGKKPKISTLEKSKLDWDKFKKEENLEEELKTYNKGKDGYLEKQDFLQRADLRRFEIEKEIRTVERNKKLHNSL